MLCVSSLFLLSITLFQALRPQAMLQKRNFCCLTLQDVWHSFKMLQFQLVFQQGKTWHQPLSRAWCCMATSSQFGMWTGFSDPRVHVWFASWSWEWKCWSVPAVAIRVASQNLIPLQTLWALKLKKTKRKDVWIGWEPRFRWQNFWRSKLGTTNALMEHHPTGLPDLI